MHIKIDDDNNILMMSVHAFPGGIQTIEPHDDVTTWFATGKYKFIDGEFVLQNDWVEPTVEEDEL